MLRRNIGSDTPWESLVGYSRAVRQGPFVFVSGTAPADASGCIVGGDDPYAQAQACLEKIGQALSSLGAGFDDVVRTRMFVTDISQWQAIGRAHAEIFGDIRPATSMVEVSRLISDGMLVEIEVDAIVDEG